MLRYHLVIKLAEAFFENQQIVTKTTAAWRFSEIFKVTFGGTEANKENSMNYNPQNVFTSKNKLFRDK